MRVVERLFVAALLLVSSCCAQTITLGGASSGVRIGSAAALHAFSAGGGSNWGDSITVGQNASNPATTSYRALIDAWIGGTFNTNTGFGGTYYAGGYGCGDVAHNLHFHAQFGASYNATLLVGTNDANHNLADNQTILADYASCHKALIAEVLPASAKVYATDAACSRSGTWVADTSGLWITGEALKSVTTGSSLSCTVTTTGNPIYILADAWSANGGSFPVTIDGVGKGTVATTTQYYSTNAYTSAPFLIRYPVAAGTHTVVIGGTVDTNPVVIGWVGSPPSSYAGTEPIMWVGGVLRQSSANSATDPVTLDYNNTVLADVNQLAGDGVRVVFVDTRSSMNNTTDMSDQFHPSDAGYNKLYLAFQAVM
jgi:lysophospholipase L1-like esterase